MGAPADPGTHLPEPVPELLLAWHQVLPIAQHDDLDEAAPRQPLPPPPLPGAPAYHRRGSQLTALPRPVANNMASWISMLLSEISLQSVLALSIFPPMDQ